MKTGKSIPRGIRNNNPLNIRKGDKWVGLDLEKTAAEKDFCVFTSMHFGFRAAFRILARYRNRQWDTLEKIIAHWAPESENETEAYVRQICKYTGLSRNVPLEYEYYPILVKAMYKIENGFFPDDETDELIDKCHSLYFTT